MCSYSWEPVHYLIYGTGLQTWEYSPLYTLRSYAYLLPHAAIGKVMSLILGLIQVPPQNLYYDHLTMCVLQDEQWGFS